MSDNSGIVNIRGREYQTVALRVQKFRDAHPIESGWRIVTSPHHIDADVVVMRAEIVSPDGHIVATGHAEENRASSQINSTSALENCETSAIGRALAAAGLGGTEYATANELANAIHQQSNGQHASQEQRADSVASQVPGVRRGAITPETSPEYDEFRAEIKLVVDRMDDEDRERLFPDPGEIKKKLIRLVLKEKIFASADEMVQSRDKESFAHAYRLWCEYVDHQCATPF